MRPPSPTPCVLGAQDVVTLANRSRLQSVATRELRAYRLERALSTTLSSAREYREQLQNFLEGSADAITHVQEGIIVDANRAWLELFGYFGRRCAHRHAAHGFVRAGDASRAQRRSGGLLAGQVVGSWPQGAGAAVGRLHLGARAAAHQGRLRERAGDSHCHLGHAQEGPRSRSSARRRGQERCLDPLSAAALLDRRRARALCARHEGRRAPVRAHQAGPLHRHPELPSGCSPARTSWRSSPNCCARS